MGVPAPLQSAFGGPPCLTCVPFRGEFSASLYNQKLKSSLKICSQACVEVDMQEKDRYPTPCVQCVPRGTGAEGDSHSRLGSRIHFSPGSGLGSQGGGAQQARAIRCQEVMESGSSSDRSCSARRSGGEASGLGLGASTLEE